MQRFWKITLLEHAGAREIGPTDPADDRDIPIWEICRQEQFVALGYDLPPFNGRHFPKEQQYKSVMAGDIMVVHIKGQNIRAIAEVALPYGKVNDDKFGNKGWMSHRVAVRWLKDYPEGEKFPPGFPVQASFAELTKPAHIQRIAALLK
ncbi:MAG: hypothetical protein NTZ05_05630 [Chloroflexi bacterium]|nr:hypothetical protein [Chloroflexota bacterium]